MYKKAIITFLIFSGSMLFILGAFNFSNDPFCYFKCGDFSADTSTENYFLHPAQFILRNPDAEAIILGSSRGRLIPEKWVEEKTGFKTINLSVPGADFVLKSSLLNYAKKHLKKLKLVIYQVDYFELTRSATSEKVLYAEPYFEYLPFKSGVSSYHVKKFKALIDHKTFEAILKHKRGGKPDAELGIFPLTQSYEKCLNFSYEKADHKELAATKNDFLNRLITSSEGLARRFLPAQDKEYIEAFDLEIKKLESEKIAVVALAPPYHLDFWNQYKKDYPKFVQQHVDWLKHLEGLKSSYFQFLDYNWGFPEDNQTEFFWQDLNHLQCNFYIHTLGEPLKKAAQQFLKSQHTNFQ